MKINQMAEVDCYKYSGIVGVTNSTKSFPQYTKAIHSNADQTVYVKDKYGNLTKKVMLAGVTYVGEYTYVGKDANTLVDVDVVTLVF